MSGMKFLNTQNIFIAIVVAILLAALYSYSFSKTHWYDGMSSNDASGNTQSGTSTTTVNRVVPESDSGYKSNPISDPSDLLPKDVNSQWSTLNPDMTASNVANADLLPAGSHMGMISQVLRNTNLTVRSDPPIPKVAVSPWNQSTIEPDIGRVPFEIGQGAL